MEDIGILYCINEATGIAKSGHEQQLSGSRSTIDCYQ